MIFSHKKYRILCGVLMLLCGLLLMFEPMLTHLEGHPHLRHFIIVLGAVGVLLSFPLIGSNREK